MGRKPSVCGNWDLNTVSGLNFLNNTLSKFLPKQPGKLRDFLIVRKLVFHKKNFYSSFDELNNETDTKLRDIFISKNEKMSLNVEQKKSVGQNNFIAPPHGPLPVRGALVFSDK